VIRADEIRDAGVSRLGDLIFLLDGWTGVTIDGFTWEMAPRGMGGDPAASYVVIVDGIRVEADQFGTTALNRVPVHVAEIDSVEVIELPQLHHGELSDRGIIHIHTQGGAGGFGFGGTAVTGNEAGDPGPYAFTDLGTPNVDRFGPDFAARGEYGEPGAYVRCSFFRYRHYPTDEAVRRRNYRIVSPEYPQVTLSGLSGAMEGAFLGGRHRGFLSRTRFDDFFFFETYGREIPVVSELASGGISGSIPAGERAAFDYRLSYTRASAGFWRNGLDLDFDWRRERWAGDVEMRLRSGAFGHLYGVGFERVEATTGYSLGDDDYHLSKVYADWTLRLPKRFAHRLSARVLGGGGDLSFDAAASEGWVMSPEHAATLLVSYIERRPEHDGRIWFWDERGYGFLEAAGVAVTRDEGVGTCRKWTADAEWAARWVDGLSTGLTGYLRDFSNLYLEEQRFEFDAEEGAFRAPVHLLPEVEGRVVGGELVLEARPSERLRLRSVYRFEKAVSCDGAFRVLWDRVPRHLFRQSAWWAPYRGVTAWAQARFASETEWREYEDAFAQSDGEYKSTVDSYWTIDAALAKRLWRDRLKASLLLRDIFRQKPRYHPIGAAFDTSLFIEIAVGAGATGP
jgi:hypothetical protein